MRIGVIGLGSMGKPMARNVAADGDSVVAYDLDARAVREIACEDVHGAGSAREVAQRCELVLIMVWDDKALRPRSCSAATASWHARPFAGTWSTSAPPRSPSPTRWARRCAAGARDSSTLR